MYIDLHSHLDLCKDTENIVKNARKAGIKIIIASGISPKSNRLALELAEKYDIVKPTIGLYPIDAMRTEIGGKYTVDIDKELEFVRQNNKKILAIGEIGLDYKTGSNKAEQETLFRKQLELAQELDKPVIIHSRNAEEDVLRILSEYNPKIILHCFSGKKKLVQQAIESRYFFTIPTAVVRSQQFQLMADLVPLQQLFCETDSPFMSPFTDKSNEPAFVVESYKKIAEIKGMDIKELANIVYNNFQIVFQ